MKGPDADRFAYNRDYMGSPTGVARTAASRTIYQVHQYDELSRIKGSFGYSTPLNVVPSRIHAWSLDSLGNWREFDDSNPALEQVRDVNNANEITDITETVGAAWTTPLYDAAGNMTRLPPATSPTGTLNATYDAWNRLRQISVPIGSLVLVRYEYDGLNRRTVKDPLPASSLPNNQYFYYNEDWQELEVRKEVTTGVISSHPLEQFVWHPYYIDALATRFYDADIDGIDVEQHYFVHDANYNVTAAVDDTGAVVERYHYSAYGEISYLNPDFTAAGTTSTIGNHTTYTGRRRDTESGLYHYRNRYYYPQLGKFLTRDPIGYEGSPWNLYQYVGTRPTSAIDASGLAWHHCNYDRMFTTPRSRPMSYRSVTCYFRCRCINTVGDSLEVTYPISAARGNSAANEERCRRVISSVIALGDCDDDDPKCPHPDPVPDPYPVPPIAPPIPVPGPQPNPIPNPRWPSLRFPTIPIFVIPPWMVPSDDPFRPGKIA